MSGTLVDTNVLLDIVTKDVNWAERSLHALESASLKGSLLINDVVYAELSVRFAKIEDLDSVVDEGGLAHAAIPRQALFLAGKAFQRYRASGGPRTSILPDFFIGAHAAVSGVALLTRDPRRYQNYFPTVQLIAP